MRLTPKQKTEWRQKRLLELNSKCALCLLPIVRPVCDHNHKSGAIRDVICAGCNSILGAVENGKRRGLQNVQAFADNVGRYLMVHSTSQHGLTHDSFRTPEEKKLRIKKRAKRRKASDTNRTPSKTNS